MSVGVQLDARAALAGIRAARREVRAIPRAIAKAGAFTVTVVRANASTGTHPPGDGHIEGTGPGPNVATGDYRRSITSTNEEGDGQASSDVSTNAVQAERLEFGFVGRDSLNRYYTQPPFPHWEPAEGPVTEFADELLGKVDDAIHDALTGGT